MSELVVIIKEQTLANTLSVLRNVDDWLSTTAKYYHKDSHIRQLRNNILIVMNQIRTDADGFGKKIMKDKE